jgi:cytochrome c-type biogenesis protein CcmH/NrfG
VWPALAALLGCAAYLNALDNPFVYDDHDTVVANASLVDLSNVKFLLVYSPFRPVVNVSYAVDRWLWGVHPFGYHLTNIVLHGIAVVLVFALIRRLLADSGRRDAAHLCAGAAAALFAVHPIQSEAVGYVSGRSEVMCAVWFLAALLLARDAILSRSGGRALGAIVCGALSIASKETGLMLPLVVLGYDWLLRPGDDTARRRRFWRFFLPAFVLLGGLAGYRLLAMGASPWATHTPLLNLLTQAVVVWRYVGLLAWPWGQSIMHGVHRATSVLDPAGWIALAGLAAASAGALLVRRSHPVITLGILWFLAVLAPSSSVVALREGMAEHRVYLASVGIFMSAASVLAARLEGERPEHRVNRAVAAGLAVVVLICLVLTVLRNQIWASPVTLWAEATVRAQGMWEPHYALADSLREKGDCRAALPEYRAVVALRPEHRDAFTNLGICLAQTGELAEAEQVFRRVLEIDPSFPRGYTNLGALALVAGDTARARDYYREALAQDPDNVLARMQLASLYEHTFHDYHAAARMCGEARSLAPSTAGVVDCVERNQRLAADKDAGR